MLARRCRQAEERVLMGPEEQAVVCLTGVGLASALPQTNAVHTSFARPSGHGENGLQRPSLPSATLFSGVARHPAASTGHAQAQGQQPHRQAGLYSHALMQIDELALRVYLARWILPAAPALTLSSRQSS